jgi:hypothetical protein
MSFGGLCQKNRPKGLFDAYAMGAFPQSLPQGRAHRLRKKFWRLALETVYGSVVLRPARIGFLVRPSQQNFSQVREIIRTSTCLWGGMFNPLIPVCTALPTAWRQEHFRDITGRGLAEAYIRFFEPEVFVEAEAGLAKEAGIADAKSPLSERVIPLKQFVKGEERRRADFVFGLSALDIYKDLYQEEFKFASRKPRKVAAFQNADPYCEAVFGDFPRAQTFRYLKKAYVDVCEPQTFPATAESCLKLFREGHLTPLRAGLHKLDVTFENRDDPTIFVLDPTKTVDLIDFWNLRQFRKNVLPINVNWINQFEDMVRKLVTSNHRPLPGNKHGVMIHTTLEFARSISKATKDTIVATHFHNLPAGSAIRKDWYDPIWRTDWRNGGIQPRRPSLAPTKLTLKKPWTSAKPRFDFPHRNQDLRVGIRSQTIMLVG